MAVGYIPLPAYRTPGPLDFSGLNEGLDVLGKSIERNKLLAEQKEIGKALQSGNQQTATSSSQPQYGKQNALLSGGSSPYSSAIANIETGSFKQPYTALGPTVQSGDRAYGKYQVMGSNIGPWTREILGQEMTPEQFLASPDAQEKVFAGKFGQYVQKTGNPQDAASMWFTGRPAAEGANRRARDVNGNPLGITGREYVDKFSAGLGQGGAQPAPTPQPQQGGSNYANAANIAFGQGNLDIGLQLANAQRQEQEAAYNRQRQATADQRAAETHELGMEDSQDQMRNRLVDRMAGVAQAIRNEADPQRKSDMVRKLMQANPRLRQTLGAYGFDPRNPDPTMDMIIAEARGLGGTDKARYEFTKYGVGDKFSGEVTPYSPGTLPPEDKVESTKLEQSLRKEFADLSKNYRAVQEGADRVRVGANLDNGVGDLSLIFGYMKLLDPGSVVREGEFANAENAQGVPDRIRNTWNKLVNGERLTPRMRNEFVTAAQSLANEQLQRQSRIVDQFTGIAQEAGLDPSRIVMDFGPNAQDDQPAPQIRVRSPDEAQQLIQSGKLKSGDQFIDHEGNVRTVN